MGGWKPGQSGNPGGRPKMDAEALEIRDLARIHAPRAIGRIAQIMLESEDEAIILKAADLILQRGFGRVTPVAVHELEDRADDTDELALRLAKDPDGRRLLDGLAAAQERLAGNAS